MLLIDIFCMLRFRIEFTHDYGDKYEFKWFETIEEALKYCWLIIPDKDKIYDSDKEFEEIIISKPHKYVFTEADRLTVAEEGWDYNLEIYDTYRE